MIILLCVWWFSSCLAADSCFLPVVDKFVDHIIDSLVVVVIVTLQQLVNRCRTGGRVDLPPPTSTVVPFSSQSFFQRLQRK